MKISEPEINEVIFSGSFQHMNTNQRVALILRPHLIQSDMEEILLNIYKINNFTLIKVLFRFKKFTILIILINRDNILN